MRETFDIMAEHPFLTLFLGIIFLLSISEIASIFKKDNK
jgi:hypothetical protein